jgi:hypothetical protein
VQRRTILLAGNLRQRWGVCGKYRPAISQQTFCDFETTLRAAIRDRLKQRLKGCSGGPSGRAPPVSSDATALAPPLTT